MNCTSLNYNLFEKWNLEFNPNIIILVWVECWVDWVRPHPLSTWSNPNCNIGFYGYISISILTGMGGELVEKLWDLGLSLATMDWNIGFYGYISISILRIYRKYRLIFFHKCRWSENYLKFIRMLEKILKKW